MLNFTRDKNGADLRVSQELMVAADAEGIVRTYRPLPLRDNHIDREVDIGGTIDDGVEAPTEPLSFRLVVECRLGARTVSCQFAHCPKDMEAGTRWGEKTEVLRTCTSKGKLQVWPVDSLPKRPIRPASSKPGDVIRPRGDVNDSQGDVIDQRNVNGSQGDVIDQRNDTNSSQGDVIGQRNVVIGSQGKVIDRRNVINGSQGEVIGPRDDVIITPGMTSSQSASTTKANLEERIENDFPKEDYECLRFPGRDERGVCEAGEGDVERGGGANGGIGLYGDDEEGEEEKGEESPRPISRPTTPRRVSFAPTEQVSVAQSLLGRKVHGSTHSLMNGPTNHRIYVRQYVCSRDQTPLFQS